MRSPLHRWTPILLALTACAVEVDEEPVELRPDTTDAAVAWSPEPGLTLDDIERGRYDDDWRHAPSIDSLIAADTSAVADAPRRFPADSIAIPEEWDDIGQETAPERTAAAIHLPLGGKVAGPSVLYVQVLLDRAAFSPGLIDGKWGKNSEKAVFWFQHREGLPRTGQVDSLTLRRLTERAARPEAYLTAVALTAADVAGPFVPIPEDVYAQDDLTCLCYSSLAEKLGEQFHADPALLERLNPGVVLDSVQAGDTLRVPNVGERNTLDAPAGSGRVARLVISDQGHYLHALDDQGKILLHAPATLGSQYEPSPEGRLEIVRITEDPWFHWQPELLEGVDPTDAPTRLPPGPNNPVGVVWMQLSEEHYGVHGSRDPASIGYATSSGCIRLTNWDAMRLAELVGPGTPVEFRDVVAGGGITPPDSTIASR